MGRAETIGVGVAITAGLVGGVLMQDRVERTGRLPRADRDYVRPGWPRREILENTAALAGAGALFHVGSQLELRSGALAGVGALTSSVGLGFLAGQAMGFIW